MPAYCVRACSGHKHRHLNRQTYIFHAHPSRSVGSHPYGAGNTTIVLAHIMSERLRSSCILNFVTDGRGQVKDCQFIRWSRLFNYPYYCKKKNGTNLKEVKLLAQTSLKTQTILNYLLQHNLCTLSFIVNGALIECFYDFKPSIKS